MIYRKLRKEEYKTYEELLNLSSPIYIFQSLVYLEELKELNNDYIIYGAFKDEKLLSALPIQIKKVPLIKRYIYSNPVDIVGIFDKALFEYAYNDLKKNGFKISFSSSTELEIKDFKSLNNSVTIEIDLLKEIDDIFSEFSKTVRNCVRKGNKENVLVEIKKDKTTIKLFLELYKKMTSRKELKEINIKFLENILNNLIKNDLGFFAVASFDDVIYNIAFISTLGDRGRYLYGASRLTPPKTPPIGQLLQYEVIKHLKEKGYKLYDLGGISSSELKPDDKSYGVDKFKRSFGGKIVLTSFHYHYYKNKMIEKIFK